MSNLPLAFLLGLLGSVHCAVMCGPLMLGLPMSQKNTWQYAMQLFSYQLGRTLVYTLLGMVVGLLGSSISLFAGQQNFSLLFGIMLIVLTLMSLSGRYFKNIDRIQLKLIAPISKLMGRVYGMRLWGFFAGILNGFIPCGMVYLALASALSAPSFLEAGWFMFLFGAGTVPLMLFISLGGIYLKKYIRFNPNKLLPWFMIFLGTLYILRSAELNIPFLSPPLPCAFQWAGV